MAQIAAEKENKDQVIEVTFKQQRQWEPALRSYYTSCGFFADVISDPLLIFLKNRKRHQPRIQ